MECLAKCFVTARLSQRALWSARRSIACSPIKLQESVKPDTGPLKFLDSDAEKWQTSQTFGSPKLRSRPWYEPYVLMVSTSVFLIYFCVLREENDLDEELGRTLWDRVPALKEVQLKTTIEQYQSEGRDTSDLYKNLKEVRERAAAAKAAGSS